MRQIPLPFTRFEPFRFADFVTGPNREALQQLGSVAAGQAPGNVYLWGRSGTGKSHLLQAACSAAAGNRRQAAYIPLQLIDELEPELLRGLERLDLVCIDDLQQAARRPPWEQALLHLYNRLRDGGRPLILAATHGPQGIGIELPDLKSRLSWDLCYHLEPLDEAALVDALKHRARTRGFDLPDDVTRYLITRVARDTHNLFRLLARLDSASLASQRKLSVHFVRELLDREPEH